MILYIFNNPFPDNSGFGKRCHKEIEILSSQQEVVVLCKKRPSEKEKEEMILGSKAVQIVRYSTFFQNNEGLANYQKNRGIYEIVRAVDLLLGMIGKLLQLLWQMRSQPVQMYVIVSPLTVPLICSFFGSLFRAKSHVIEFHDLEPELAMHIKHLHKKSFITRVEFFLEKFVCNRYNKIIVTTASQAKRMQERTGVGQERILVIPNAIQAAVHKKNIIRETHNNAHVIVGYVSSFTYSHSINELQRLLRYIAANKKQFAKIHLQIVGDGVLLADIKQMIEERGIADIVTCTGRVHNVTELIEQFDIALIPWEEDDMTITMAPTKLFEYLSAGKAIIAPDFGEFSRLLQHDADALLFRSTDQLASAITRLEQDPDLRIRLGKAAQQKYYDLYEPRNLARQLLRFIP